MAATIAPDSTRGRLVTAAVDVFSERGYQGAGVQEIARRAGLTTGAIYANFRGKADLLLEAIGARSGDELDDLLGSDRAGGGSAADVLAELGTHLLDEPAPEDAGAGLLIEAIVAARRDEELALLVRSLVDDRIRGIGALVDRARAEGSVDTGVSADALTRFSLVLALGSLLYHALGLERPDADDWASLVRRIVRSLQEEPST